MIELNNALYQMIVEGITKDNTAAKTAGVKHKDRRDTKEGQEYKEREEKQERIKTVSNCIIEILVCYYVKEYDLLELLCKETDRDIWFRDLIEENA